MDGLMDSVEEGLHSVGLGDGDLAPLKRAVVGTVIGYAVVSMWKPSWAYDPKTHAPYPWRLTNKDADKTTTTPVPYWMAAIIPGIVLGVLI